MSLHPSLKIDAAGTQQRSVMSRIERLKDLMKKDQWKESVRPTGLPKTKIVRIKAKKAAKAEAKEGAAGAAAPAGGAPAGKADAAKKPDAAAKKPEAGKK